ncbi:high-affinity nicotinic acid transporter [Cutaneotrichosporon oleaginosum]|uniref:High-affinity nicotinic acid transporter n=1 Tax=Cutaneotrichosporon oleaginosum TaxID=879819 RepID=A0A0J0XZY2_9TREE|nr:high-affinity nicotinic acid transporter [Cutaneotrichosporon oleaginosum]KLT46581.1 high-affinity nicotinic acid transporter [Cutaneotrichosporon oleaginosum]TXT15054.1 hypothetical protein COLE_01247 [Cutaneotrichosporon oleaginosum]
MSDSKLSPALSVRSANESASVETKVDAAVLQRAHRKLDKRLLIWYSFVYLIMRIHVGNISNTAIMNLEEKTDIKRQLGNLTPQQWAWALSIFYYPYMFFEPVSTLALKAFTPRKWMSRIMLTWGIISMCQGATQNYAGLLACRFFLGLAEAGFYPGVLYHLSFWYSPDKMPVRIAFFYACGMFSGTISGLLAYAISFMNGVSGLAGWRWMFILEGIPAILCAVVTFFWLPNYPETATFLDEEEKNAIVSHLSDDAPTMDAKFSVAQIKGLVTDPSFVPFLLIWITHGIGGWGISFVLPSVIYDLGMTTTAIAQVMTMPPYTLVFVILLSLSLLVQKRIINAWTAGIALESVQIICFILLVTIKNPVGKYILVTVATAAGQSFFPIIWPERIRATKGTTAAGLAIGTTNAACQLMGIVGPQIYNLKFGPTYRVSYCVSIGLLSGTIASLLLTWYAVARSDRRARNATSADEEKEAIGSAVENEKA